MYCVMAGFVCVNVSVRGRAGMICVCVCVCALAHSVASCAGAHQPRPPEDRGADLGGRGFSGSGFQMQTEELGAQPATSSGYCHTKPGWGKFRPGKGCRVKPMRGCGTEVRVARVWTASPRRDPQERQAVAPNMGIHRGGPHLCLVCPQGHMGGGPNLQIPLCECVTS